ncbi:MAG TPA: hypothetical protein VGH57_16480 [Amycolatopsis sp.]|jgi:hypothetical protein
MGLKLTGPFQCGACGKPRGLGTHLCSPGRRRRGKTTLRNPLGWECSRCKQPRGLSHACGNRGDFAKRKRAARAADRKGKRKAETARRAARRKQVAADRRARDRARKAAAKKRAGKPRPRGDAHEPGTCGNRDCPKYGCKNYWRGMDDCPGPHEGE